MTPQLASFKPARAPAQRSGGQDNRAFFTNSINTEFLCHKKSPSSLIIEKLIIQRPILNNEQAIKN
jgi:hypothetical protein